MIFIFFYYTLIYHHYFYIFFVNLGICGNLYFGIFSKVCLTAHLFVLKGRHVCPVASQSGSKNRIEAAKSAPIFKKNRNPLVCNFFQNVCNAASMQTSHPPGVSTGEIERDSFCRCNFFLCLRRSRQFKKILKLKFKHNNVNPLISLII